MKFWHPDPEQTARVVSLAEKLEAKLIIDIGAGNGHKFPLATKTVGWDKNCNIKTDLDNGRLPFDDGEVDFVYCRHTIEDLANPERLLSEIRRIAKAGYIETPSPQAELTRGVDAFGTHLGYIHHRWIVYVGKNGLRLLPKYPVIERLPIPDQWVYLRDSPRNWNTCYAWEGKLPFKALKHEVDFKLSSYDERGLPVEYLNQIEEALK